MGPPLFKPPSLLPFLAATDPWSNIKGQELANRWSANLGEAATAVRQGMDRVRHQARQLAFSFITPAFLFDSNVTVLCETQ